MDRHQIGFDLLHLRIFPAFTLHPEKLEQQQEDHKPLSHSKCSKLEVCENRPFREFPRHVLRFLNSHMLPAKPGALVSCEFSLRLIVARLVRFRAAKVPDIPSGAMVLPAPFTRKGEFPVLTMHRL